MPLTNVKNASRMLWAKPEKRFAANPYAVNDRCGIAPCR
jgi:hypothetical protein